MVLEYWELNVTELAPSIVSPEPEEGLILHVPPPEFTFLTFIKGRFFSKLIPTADIAGRNISIPVTQLQTPPVIALQSVLLSTAPQDPLPLHEV